MRKQLLYVLILFASIMTYADAQIMTVGVIGTATPGGWDTDSSMVQDAIDTALWTLDIELVPGELKFRANDDWAINWGNTDFPVGTGTQDGPNIPIPFGGFFHIEFNSNTGDYSFSPVNSPIGIIGSATPGGWDEDTDMFMDTIENGFFIVMDLVEGEAKFRKDNDWAVNWGAADFPSGIAIQDGENIPIPKAGQYRITFDTLTGAYNFSEIVKFETIGIIGSATPGGWDEDTDMTQTGDPDVWTVDLTLVDGEAKFRADNDWAVNWGGEDFPSGTATESGPNIPVVAGNYRVMFNTATLEYSFIELQEYATIGIIGSATPGGWDEDTDMEKDPNDGTIWHATMELVDGEAKFRADNDWAVNWGGPDFPMGVATMNGANIPIQAGRYNITFNSLTGEYNFEAFVVYDQVSIVGKDGPFGQWPDETTNFDAFMVRDAEDDQLWKLTQVNLTTADTTLGDSGIKFRANADWTVNWGARDFPSGVGTQDGPNIWCTAGIWDVSLNTQSGEYAFMLSTGTDDFTTINDIKLFPNPVSQAIISISIDSKNISKPLVYKIMNTAGQLIQTGNVLARNHFDISIENLSSGTYSLVLNNENFYAVKRFVVHR